MIKMVAVLSLLLCAAGCVTINEQLLLPQGTKVEVSDITSDGLNVGYLANIDHKGIQKDIVRRTEEQLRKLNIETANGSPDAAHLKYRVNYIKFKGDELEIGYFVTLETTDGRTIFNDSDEKQERTFEEIIDQIAKRVAGYTAKSFKQPVTIVRKESQNFNTTAAPADR